MYAPYPRENNASTQNGNPHFCFFFNAVRRKAAGRCSRYKQLTMAFRSAALVDLSSDGPQSYQGHRTALLRHLEQMLSPRRLNELVSTVDKVGMQVLQSRNNDGCGETYNCQLYAQVSGRSVAIATTRTQHRTAVTARFLLCTLCC